jgi:hypothetical protein
MRCEDASRALYAGETGPELEIHLSACDECRLLAEDLAEMQKAFARARAEWAPSPAFRVRLPEIPWKRLAVAAAILVLPLFGWAANSFRTPEPSYGVGAILQPRPPSPPPSDREILATIFPEVMQP